VRRLHRLRDNSTQLRTDRIQRHVVAQARRERRQRALRVVAAAKEAPVDDRLEAGPGRAEKRSDRERRARDGEVRLLGQRSEHELEHEHQRQVGAGQRGRERAVDERTADDGVDVVEPMPEHGVADCDRQQRERGREQVADDRADRAPGVLFEGDHEREEHDVDPNEQRASECDPAQLDPPMRIRPAIAPYQGGERDDEAGQHHEEDRVCALQRLHPQRVRGAGKLLHRPGLHERRRERHRDRRQRYVGEPAPPRRGQRTVR